MGTMLAVAGVVVACLWASDQDAQAKSALLPQLHEFLDQANRLEYTMRQDADRDLPEPEWVQTHAPLIEAWRTTVAHYLEAHLTGSSAVARFQTFSPVTGHGPQRYEYERLIAMRENLVTIMVDLEKFRRQR